MSHIHDTSYTESELAEYCGIKESQILVTRKGDEDIGRKRYSDYWDGTIHPDNGKKLSFDREYYYREGMDGRAHVISTVFKDEKGSEYSYVEHPGQSVDKQIGMDRQEYYQSRSMGNSQSADNTPPSNEQTHVNDNGQSM